MKRVKRSNQSELIDLGPAYYTTEEFDDCHLQLDRVGRFLGGDRATIKIFKNLKFQPKSILDVGCGGGLFTIRLANLFPEADVVGIDIADDAIEFANKQIKIQKKPPLNLIFKKLEEPNLKFPDKSFDVITATLLCHHLDDAELIQFLKQSYKIAKNGIILNDLHRHPLASAGFALLTPLFFRNRLVAQDGLLSIRRSFKRAEWFEYLKAADIPLERCFVSWHWAFRWIVYIDTTEKK
ncbi:MAG: methyltransferase domain-containing protein [Parachlamydiaceae bacterium]|nr:methyltransferase domain-containing protein [Parachlamydiaceae bacterium]